MDMGNENKIETRNYLEDYELVYKIRDFFTNFVGDISQYDYVAATSNSCFNCAYIFLSQKYKSNLITLDALLQYHYKISQYFTEKGYFPKILILDDILVDGMEISKYLASLEELIKNDIFAVVEVKDQFDMFKKLGKQRDELVKAVDIYAFARNKRPLLLDDKYRYCLKSANVLLGASLNDLKLQLSDSVTRWRKANTCFEYSEHNELLWNMLIQDDTIKNIKIKDWRQIHWKFDHESMGIFVSFDGENQVNKISTIRFFPGRKRQKWFTSFSMIGELSNNEILEIGRRISNILKNESSGDYNHLINILNGEVKYLNSGIAQLISYLNSVLSYRSFLKSIPNYEYNTPDENFILQNTDVDKVCRNFGKVGDVFQGLVNILCSEKLMESINCILMEIRNRSSSICLASRDKLTAINDERLYEEYNQSIESLFCKVGIDASERRAEYFYSVREFLPLSYQAYDSSRKENNTGGIISLYDFFKDKTRDQSMNVYYCIASLIHMKDYGLIKIEISYDEFSKGQVFCCKAGDMTMICGIKRIDVAIPALALLQESSHVRFYTPVEMINKFLCLLDEDVIKKLIQTDDLTWKTEYEKLFYSLKEEIPKITKDIYRGVFDYTQFNFKNLTEMEGLPKQRLQWALLYFAQTKLLGYGNYYEEQDSSKQLTKTNNSIEHK